MEKLLSAAGSPKGYKNPSTGTSKAHLINIGKNSKTML